MKNDKMDALEKLAARARLEPMPVFRANASAVRFRAVPMKLPTLSLCLSSGLTGLAACLMVAFALHHQVDQTSVTSSGAVGGKQILATQSAGQVDSQTKSPAKNPGAVDPSSAALFSPLFAELP